jgi:hypothetical protein
MIKSKGTGQAAVLLGCSVHTMERAVGGLEMNPGTVALLEKKISDRDALGRVP